MIIPSYDKVQEVLKSLRLSVKVLLRKHSSKKPPFTPNYFGFHQDMDELLEPIYAYFDNEFHKGNVTDATLDAAMRIVAALKWDIENEYKTSVQKRGPDHSKSVNFYCAFKLLTHWFGYAEIGRQRIRAMFDLTYQAERTEDPAKRRKLLSEMENIFSDSATACYIKSIEYFKTGNLEGALVECNEGISRCPDATNLYSLRAKIYAAMSQVSIVEGLMIEPRDSILLASELINNKLLELRSKFAKGDVDADVFIKTLEKTISGSLHDDLHDIKLYRERIENYLGNTVKLQAETLIFLTTGEYLLERTPGGFDYAPSAVEFCKAIEIELEQNILLPFKLYTGTNISKESLKTKENNGLWDFCFRCKSMTLGGLAFILQISASQSKIDKDLLLKLFADYLLKRSDCETILGISGIRELLTPVKVDKYRNGAAHAHVFPKERAEATAKWCYSILNILFNKNSSLEAEEETVTH